MESSAGPMAQASQDMVRTPSLPESPRKVLLRVSEDILHDLEELNLKGERTMPKHYRTKVIQLAAALGEEDLNPLNHRFVRVVAAMQFIFWLQGQKLLLTPPDLVAEEEEHVRRAGWNI